MKRRDKFYSFGFGVAAGAGAFFLVGAGLLALGAGAITTTVGICAAGAGVTAIGAAVASTASRKYLLEIKPIALMAGIFTAIGLSSYAAPNIISKDLQRQLSTSYSRVSHAQSPSKPSDELNTLPLQEHFNKTHYSIQKSETKTRPQLSLTPTL